MLINKHITYIVKHNNNQINNDDLDTSAKLSLQLNENHQKNLFLIHRVLKEQIRQHRHGNAHSKTRSEIRGGGKKPWKQKGTGRARAGSSRSPLWKGGGVIFGPKPKTISLKLNKKERRLALQTLLYNKKNSIVVIENLEAELIESRTKKFLEICTNCNINLDQKVLVVVSKKTIPLKLATQNIRNVELILASNLNTFSLLKAKQIILTPLALNNIKEIYCD